MFYSYYICNIVTWLYFNRPKPRFATPPRIRHHPEDTTSIILRLMVVLSRPSRMLEHKSRSSSVKSHPPQSEISHNVRFRWSVDILAPSNLSPWRVWTSLLKCTLGLPASPHPYRRLLLDIHHREYPYLLRIEDPKKYKADAACSHAKEAHTNSTPSEEEESPHRTSSRWNTSLVQSVGD